MLMLTRCGKCAAGSGGGGFPVSGAVLHLNAQASDVFENTGCTDTVENGDDIACWHDLSSNGFEATQTVVSKRGDWYEIGPYASLDGVDDFLEIADSPDFTFGDGVSDDPFSVTTWLVPEGTSAGGVISKASGNVAGEWYILFSASEIFFALVDDSAGARLRVSASLPSGLSWRHLACTYDGSATNAGMKIYLDGASVSTSNSNFGSYTAMENTTEVVRIGARGSSEVYQCKLNHTSLFDRELSAAEVALIAGYGRPGATTLPVTQDLVGHWKASEEVYTDTARTTAATSNGDAVKAWDDISASGNTLTEATNNPTLQLSVINGKPVVRFDGVDDVLTSTFTLNQPAHVFFVCKVNTWTLNSRFFDGTSTNFMGGYVSAVSPNTVTIFANGGSGGLSSTTTDDTLLLDCFYDGANSEFQINDGSRVTGSIGTAIPGGLVVGRAGGGGLHGDIDVAEIAIYAAEQTGASLTSIRNYFNTAYSLW